MSHFAEIGGLSAFTITTEISAGSITEVVILSGIQATVQRVIVAEQDFIDSGALGNPSNWVQCSYTNRIRNVYPGIGYIYESIRDMFYPPQPFPSWKLNPVPITELDDNNNIVIKRHQYIWEPPTQYPKDGGYYTWDENNLTWETRA